MVTDLLSRAVDVLRRGGVVAFPTETVYGLGADASNAEAVKKIFAIKGRPPTNPLIVHVADSGVARRYAAIWPDAAEQLARRFWPGSLTLVLPRTPEIAPEVSAGLGTVGLRSPDHPLALELLRAFDGPVAAPSANRSNRVSPTLAAHVTDEFGDAVDLVLDGGSCRVGIESTVLDLSTPRPVILRPGAVTREMIESVIGPIMALRGGRAPPDGPATSPGQQPVHYAPATPTYRFESHDFWYPRNPTGTRPRARTALVLLDGSPAHTNLVPARAPKQIRIMPADPQHYARLLYATLREQDARGLDSIFIELPPLIPQWDAIRDRLTRASKPCPS